MSMQYGVSKSRVHYIPYTEDCKTMMHIGCFSSRIGKFAGDATLQTTPLSL